MDIGLNVLKPDRVITRIFFRLGLINNEKEYWETVKVGIKISKIINKPIRVTDILFVQYGQMLDEVESMCLKDNPNCIKCNIKKYCNYKPENNDTVQLHITNGNSCGRYSRPWVPKNSSRR